MRAAALIFFITLNALIAKPSWVPYGGFNEKLPKQMLAAIESDDLNSVLELAPRVSSYQITKAYNIALALKRKKIAQIILKAHARPIAHRLGEKLQD